MRKTKLSVNVNKIATLRNSRGGNYPNVCDFAIDIQNFGAQGITVHPRPDERHIRYQDVYDLKKVVNTELDKIKDYFDSNGLTISIDKTSYLHSKPTGQLDKK